MYGRNFSEKDLKNGDFSIMNNTFKDSCSVSRLILHK